MKKARRAKGTGCVFKKSTGGYAYRYRDLTGKVRTILLRDEDGCPITKKHDAEKAAKRHQREQYELRSLNSKTEYLTRVAEYKDLISHNRITIEGMWEAYLKSPRRPDSSSGTLDFYHDAVLPFQKWMEERHGEIVEVRDVTEEIAGVNASVIPDPQGDYEEERRLLYVGVTRAEKELVISYYRDSCGHAEEPSPFLGDVLRSQSAMFCPAEDDKKKRKRKKKKIIGKTDKSCKNLE